MKTCDLPKPETLVLFQEGRPHKLMGHGRGSIRGLSEIWKDRDFAYVRLSRDEWAKIDADSIPAVSEFRWWFKKTKTANTGYAVTGINKPNGKRGALFMHTLLAGCPDRPFVDHIDRDGLNNTKSNLRPCSRAENGMNQPKNARNSSGYKGVNFHKMTGKYQARVKAFGVRKYLGLFDTPELAHAAYAEEARKLHGEFFRQ